MGRFTRVLAWTVATAFALATAGLIAGVLLIARRKPGTKPND